MTIKRKTNECDARCKTCVHHGYVSGGICCSYILDEGVRRGCPAGKDCDKYKKGKVRRFKSERSCYAKV